MSREQVAVVQQSFAKVAPIADQAAVMFYDRLLSPDGGAIILTASVAGANGGLAGSTVYGSTKAALRSFGRTIAKELTPRGIRVNRSSPRSLTKAALHRFRRTTLPRERRPAFRSAALAPQSKSPPQPSISRPTPPTPPAPSYSSTAV
jgi:NAD(P)-dependent dehydrogenase (short-subunit alcohol dehydrogenase family)